MFHGKNFCEACLALREDKENNAEACQFILSIICPIGYGYASRTNFPVDDESLQRSKDLCAGHVHSYERTNRVFNYEINTCAPMYITVGKTSFSSSVANKKTASF